MTREPRDAAVERASEERWWVVHHDDLAAMLRRARSGEDPDLLLTEYYVNSSHERVDADD